MRNFVLLWIAFFPAAAFPAAALAEEQVDFAKQIQPLFVEHCAKCHGEKKGSGKLRLHTAEAIRGSHEEHLIVPGKPDESELYERLTLPADHKKRMPKKADPLSVEKLELVRLWIEQGATMPAPEVGEPHAHAEPAKQPAKPVVVDPASPEAIAKLAASGAQVIALHGHSPLLRVSFLTSGSTTGDAEIALLSSVAPQIDSLDLARTGITDAGTSPLASLSNMTHLHLELTAITDATLAHLAGLDRLEYLNLYGTGVSDAGLEHLKALKNLRKLYLWQTKVSYGAAMAIQEAMPGLEVNLGWNHPEVKRIRLTKEMEKVKKQVKEATNRLKAAQEEKEAVTKRKAEIQKELDALNPDAKKAPAKEKTDEEKP